MNVNKTITIKKKTESEEKRNWMVGIIFCIVNM
jgi:hypothetical protein